MTLLDSLRIAWTALRSNLLRSILTTLGIIIGVASVIILVSVGSGARSEVEKQIAALGSNMLVVFSGSSRVMGRSGGAGTDLPMAEGDMAAIRDKVQGVIAISGQLNGSGPVVNGNTNWTSTLSGVHPDFATVRDWALSAGRDFSPQDIRASAKVVILGQTVVKQLFQGEDPLGATIRVKSAPFQVVGVLAAKGPVGHGPRPRRRCVDADDHGARLYRRQEPSAVRSGRSDLYQVRQQAPISRTPRKRLKP